MTIANNAKDILSADFQAKKAHGLRDLKFFIGNVSGKTVEEVCSDVNHVFASIEAGNYIVLEAWNDSHRERGAGH